MTHTKSLVKFTGIVLLASSALYAGCTPVQTKLDEETLKSIVGDLTKEEARQATAGPCNYDFLRDIPPRLTYGRHQGPYRPRIR